MSEILRCENLVKQYGSFTALNRINLTLESGKIVGLLGPNGSGKTTLIKLINGLLTPNNSYLNSWMTVKQIVDFFVDFYEDFRPELAYKMLENLGITPDKRLKSLSKGNKEKVCLILVMSRNAMLYVLDEPIAGVDPAARDYVISTIINNYNPNATVLISTHLIADIEQVLDEVVFIQNGNIILKESVDKIREENGKSVDELFREVFRW